MIMDCSLNHASKQIKLAFKLELIKPHSSHLDSMLASRLDGNKALSGTKILCKLWANFIPVIGNSLTEIPFHYCIVLGPTAKSLCTSAASGRGK